MARISIAEKRFSADWPNWNIRRGVTHPVELYVGDYICSEARTRADAFRKAERLVAVGYVQPSHTERQTEGFDVTICFGFAARA